MPNLVGTGLNQVPTNSMLGGLAYQSPDNASIKDLDLKNLSQINSEIADTAVDIFVYDTSKDSDGGAWRHRTTHTSWYNETLNTATRGSRKEFPAVAVIVAESVKVTIYDGDDPDLPMWMVLNADSSDPTKYAIVRSAGKIISSLYALNGIICDPVSFNGLFYQNFVEDACYRVNTANTIFGGSIVNRNGGMNFGLNVTSSGLVSSTVNDVAMTVLPNAPIDQATGLPVPTIAVATDGGTSIIKDDGTVADLSGFSPVTTVHIDENNVISTSNSGSPSHDFIYKTHIPSGDETYNAGIIAGSKNYYMNSNSGTIPLLRDIDMSDSSYDSKDDVVYRGGNAGFDIIMAGVNYSTTHSNPAIAYISKDYNTGYMAGDIKGAFLSDTSTMNAGPDSNIVSNGTFDSNIDGWTLRGGTGDPTHSSGTLQLAGESSFHTVRFTRNYNFIPGNVYYITWTMTGASSQGIVDYSGGTFTPTTGSTYYYPGAGTYTIKYVPTSATPDIAFVFLNTAANTGTLDNVSIIPAEADRSLNNNPLQVFGTVTKSAVATGADLVGYGGFSASNYLQQPYNSDLDFGTGNFSIMYWFNQTTHSNYQDVINRTDAGQNDGSWLIQHQNDGSIRFYIRSSSSYATLLNSGSNLITNAGWTQVVITRAGSSLKMYFNGYQVATGNSSSTITLNTAQLRISTRIATSIYPMLAANSIALTRISASAPSPEQIKKMYEDEKVLFQENSQATLYGSSDAVTALGYDDATELLHVGTSSGRSDFRGLRRINNTTTAVTTAISASKEFVAEQ